LEQRHALQYYSTSLASQARDAWKMWESVGQVGSLIILGMKRFLVYGSLVEFLEDDVVVLRGFGGQHFHTAASIAEVCENSRHGVVLQDASPHPTVDASGSPVRGRLDLQGYLSESWGIRFE